MLAGSIALGVMMIPIIARTTEELLLLVPQTLREGALALGATRARATFTVVLPAALPVILTGLRIGFTVALLSILGSETIASLAGLGHRIVHLAEAMETPRMFAYIAFAVVIAAILNTVVTSLEQRARRR